MQLQLQSKQLSEDYKSLLLQAQSLAHSFISGEHGRKAVGVGHEFWQYRSFLTGDDSRRIDWRQSAKHDHLFLQEKEWETIQKALFVCQETPSFHYRFNRRTPTTATRAHLLLLALSFILQKSGEHFSLLGIGDKKFNNNDQMIEKIAHHLEQKTMIENFDNVGKAVPLFFGDFLYELDVLKTQLIHLSNKKNNGYLIQILDRSEATFPFKGSIDFENMNTEDTYKINKSESIRDDYIKRFNAHNDDLKSICHEMGFHYLCHFTDEDPHLFLAAFLNQQGERT